VKLVERVNLDVAEAKDNLMLAKVFRLTRCSAEGVCVIDDTAILSTSNGGKDYTSPWGCEPILREYRSRAPAATLMEFWVGVPVLSVRTAEVFVTRTENTDKGFFGGHLFCGESERKSHRKREAFRNSNNCF
jgi:hypothetical protein